MANCSLPKSKILLRGIIAMKETGVQMNSGEFRVINEDRTDKFNNASDVRMLHSKTNGHEDEEGVQPCGG